MAAITPFLPAIVWTMAILNWLVIVTESFFGASMWALVHMDPEGEGMGQGTKHGYVFLLNLFFRPSLMVIMISLVFIMMNLVTGLFTSYVTSYVTSFITNADSWLQMVAMIIGAFWVIISFMETVITKCTELIFVVPNQVFTWIGGSMSSNVGMGDSGQVAGGASQGAGSMKSAVGQLGQQGLQGGQSAIKSRENKNKENKNSAQSTEDKKTDEAHIELSLIHI